MAIDSQDRTPGVAGLSDLFRLKWLYACCVEAVPCPLGCQASDSVVITAGDRLHGMPGRWTVVRCDACGLRRTSPRPTRREIGRFYPDADYRPFQLGERKTGWREWFEFNDRRIPDMVPGRMLEIGCATGSFMSRMAETGWDVVGIEPSEHAAALARRDGLDVRVGQVETSPDLTPVDLVVGWMVLEHLHDPLAALQRLHRWTRPGGRLAISVPNAESCEAAAFGEDWYALQLPTHLFHYTPMTLQAVLNAGGWHVDRVLHQRVITNSIVSLGWKLAKRHPGRLAASLTDFPAKGKWHYALFPVSAALAALGQTGRMTIWATRVS